MALAATAAVMVIAVGLAARSAIILGSRRAAVENAASPDARVLDETPKSVGGPPTGPGLAAPPAGGAAPGAAADAQQIRLLDVGGSVWAVAEVLERATSIVPSSTIVVSALDTGGAARGLATFADPARPGALLVRSDDGRVFVARPVTRGAAGATYVLRTGPGLDRFGVWPSLPQGVGRPTASDGSPAFASAGVDDDGVTYYTPVGSGPERGIAIGPRASSSDPFADAPDWTWWEPLR
jgi:hypothetical protein